MKRVLASGIFDLFHDGHRFYLAQAKKLGDHLTVVVTSDAEATRRKRVPKNPAIERAAHVSQIEGVDAVLLGREPYDLIGTIREAQPDLIALGYDQAFDGAALTQTLRAAGFDIAIVRLRRSPVTDISTSKLLRNRS